MSVKDFNKIYWKSIAELASDVQAGKISAVDLVNKSLNAIENAKEYGAILFVAKDDALRRAKKIDALVAKGEKVGKLAGVPFILKDNFLTRDVETTAASNILKGFIPPYQSTAVTKLEAEGAIMVAKANLDSFAHGSSTENSDFGVTKNPHDKERVPGGSSGGPAAAVALGLAPFSLGTDTGGSIRLPASYTGTVGLKPTYGLVSRFGVVAMASSTDVIGPITETVEDSALILDVMSGRDEHDSTTIERSPDSYTDLKLGLKGLKVGVIKQHMGEGLDPLVKKSINKTVDRLRVSGAIVKEISIPSLDLSLACYYIIQPAEVSSNLGRYDGVRFGYSEQKAKTVDDVYDLSRSYGFNSENKRRIMVGTYVLSSGYYDAYYKKAQTVRTLLINQFNEAFKEVDVLVGPTAPSVAFKIGENVKDPLKMYLSDIMTVGVNLVGVPAISVPVDEVKGLPVGFQIIAPQKADRLVLALGTKIEALRQ